MPRFKLGQSEDAPLVQTSRGLGGSRFTAPSELANRLARLQAAEETREQGIALQRAFQGGIPDEELSRVGLSRLSRPSPSLVQRGAGALFGVLDILDRPSQAILRGAGGLSGVGGDNPLSGFFGGLTGRGERIGFQDALGITPEFQTGGAGGGALNLVGTLATDPLNFLTFGASSAARRGLRTISGELGEDTAEQVARRGLDALNPEQLERLRKLPQFAEGRLDDLGREVQGGIKLSIPGQQRRTIVPGERLRAPLRSVGALDPVRPLVRRGSAREGVEAPLRARLRASGPVRLGREAFQTTGNLRGALGTGIEQRVLGSIGRARASIGSREEVIERVRGIMADANLDEATQDRILRASQGAGRLDAEGNVVRDAAGNIESETLGDVFADLATRGDDASRNAARAVEAVNDLQVNTRDLRLRPTGSTAVSRRFQAPEVAQFTDEAGERALATPSFGGLDNARVPRVFTDDARRAIKQDPALQRQLEELPPQDLHKLNEVAQERFAHTKVDQFFETDPAKIAQIQNVHAQRAIAEADFANELAEIVDPTTSNRLLYLGNEADAPIDYVETVISGKAVKVHPELKPVIDNVEASLFNPQVQGRVVQAFDDILSMWKGFATVPIWFGVGFHARNMQGNIYLNWLEGVKTSSYRQALDAQRVIERSVSRANKASILDDATLTARRETDMLGRPVREGLPEQRLRLQEAFDTRNRETFEEALRAEADGVLDEQTVQRILDARQQGVLNSGFFDSDLRGRDLIRSIRGSSRQEKAEFWRQQFTDPRNSVAIKQGSAIGGHVENNARLAHYFSKLDEGLTPLEAAESVKRTLFDYAELTLFEQQKLKRLVPFYTFMRKNTPIQLRNLMLEPRRFLTSRRLIEGISDTSESDHRALPDWALNDGQVPLPGFVGSFLAGGNAAVMGSLDLPTDAAFETIEPITQFAAWALPDALVPDEFQASRAEFFSGIVGLPGGGVTEGVKLFVEEATEVDLFTGAPLDRQGKRQIFERWTNLVPLFTKGRSLVEGILDIKRVDDPDAVDSGVTVMKAILGLNLTVVGPRRERGEMLRRLDELDQALRAARERGVDMPTITEMRSAGLIPDPG